MPFEYEENYRFHENLCSIEADVPTQGQSPDAFNLWVGAWFGMNEAPILLKDGDENISLEFGLRACKLRVKTCENSRIDQPSRLEKTVGSIRHTSMKESETSKDAKGGGNLKFGLGSFIPGFSGGVEAGGMVSGSETNTENKEYDISEPLQSVRTASGDT